jgi:hypothetical protein
MLKYKVTDNFLEKNLFFDLKEKLTSPFFPWFFQEKINDNHKKDNSSYFTHILYHNNKVNSAYFEHHAIQELIKKLKIKNLLRIKCNLYVNTKKLEKHKPHKDLNCKSLGAIFSINTNNGKTVLYDKNKEINIKSIENRILFFDANNLHSSTSTSDKKFRININFNYL